MNEYNSGCSTLYVWIQTKDEFYMHINIHDNKLKYINRNAVNVDIDTEIYTWFKNNQGNNNYVIKQSIIG